MTPLATDETRSEIGPIHCQNSSPVGPIPCPPLVSIAAATMGHLPLTEAIYRRGLKSKIHRPRSRPGRGAQNRGVHLVPSEAQSPSHCLTSPEPVAMGHPLCHRRNCVQPHLPHEIKSRGPPFIGHDP